MSNTTQNNAEDVFLHLIITFLTPMFLATVGGDVAHARAAAAHTVGSYNARNPADLLSIAQVIALGLAVLSSISLSMAGNLSIPLVLRLRGNAASLHRAAGQCRRVLPTDTSQAEDPHVQRQREDEALASVGRAEQRLAQVQAAAQQPPKGPSSAAEPATRDSQRITDPDATLLAASRAASPAQDDYRRKAWATAMTRAARDCTIGLDALLPAERRQASMRAAVLSSVAQDLLFPQPVPPRRQHD
jgi:hypothetical protein